MTIQHQPLKAGDKVEIVEGGWGIHPKHVGKVVTIHSAVTAYGETRYTTEEELSDPGVSSIHVARKTAVGRNSFRLITPAGTIDKIRGINAQIKALQAQKDGLVATLLKELES